MKNLLKENQIRKVNQVYPNLEQRQTKGIYYYKQFYLKIEQEKVIM